MVLLVLALALGAWRRNETWRDAYRLWHSVTARAPDAARAHVNMGLVYLGREEYERARHEFERAIALAPGRLRAYNNLAILYRMRGDYARSDALLEQAVRLIGGEACRAGARFSDYQELHYNLALNRQAQGDPAGAVSYYEKALACDTELSGLVAELVERHRSGGRLRGDKRFYGILEKKPVYAKIINNLAAIHLERGELAKAEEYLAILASLDPDTADLQVNLGRLAMEQGRTREAEAHLARALELRPGDGAALINLGRLGEKAGDLKGARAYYEQALAAPGHGARAALNLAVLADRAGDTDAAEGYLKQALALDAGLAGAAVNLSASTCEAGGWSLPRRYCDGR